MKKIAIIGSNSFIGKEFIKKHYSSYSIDQYSYNPKKNQIVNTEILKNYRIYDVILFLSHAKKNDAIKALKVWHGINEILKEKNLPEQYEFAQLLPSTTSR